MQIAKTVLVVDEDPGVRSMVARLARGIGVSVALSASVDEAIERIEAYGERYDAILAGTDSLQLYNEVDQIDPDQGGRVVVMSSAEIPPPFSSWLDGRTLRMPLAGAEVESVVRRVAGVA